MAWSQSTSSQTGYHQVWLWLQTGINSFLGDRERERDKTVFRWQREVATVDKQHSRCSDDARCSDEIRSVGMGGYSEIPRYRTGQWSTDTGYRCTAHSNCICGQQTFVRQRAASKNAGQNEEIEELCSLHNQEWINVNRGTCNSRGYIGGVTFSAV